MKETSIFWLMKPLGEAVGQIAVALALFAIVALVVMIWLFVAEINYKRRKK